MYESPIYNRKFCVNSEKGDKKQTNINYISKNI